MLPHALVRLLWDHTPAAPLSITAGQAATGNYDARLIELQGELTGVHQETGSKMLVLELAAGRRHFAHSSRQRSRRRSIAACCRAAC